jgi:hypothetical protein
MTDKNERGNHQGEFTLGVGGWAEYTAQMTEVSDTARHDVKVPPGKVIPVIFLPGVMGSNLRMTKKRQEELDRPDNRAWRPDDMVDKSGKAAVVTGNGLGGWFKNATPRQRQLVFDPYETEVEYYHYTENAGRFDPEGEETIAADARHQNVPDDLEPIPPLIGQRNPPPIRIGRFPNPRRQATPAQVARWRGWSEVFFSGAYGELLKTAERFLNNMLVNNALNPIWKPICADPASFGATRGTAITESDIKKIAPCWYPVHAMGYNFLVSNAVSAKVIAERIRGLVKGYKKRGFKCEEVIVVTHSMGGLVGRALLHPSYGNLNNDGDVKILGMYHNVMPTMGAASAYKRMRFGFQESWGYVASLEASILATDGKHATAILANAPAPLELLPGRAYGQGWLRVVNAHGKTLWTWPNGNATALESIYLQPPHVWWRLINPDWVNPANILEANGGGIRNVYERLKKAAHFIQAIEKTFHTTACYASFCESAERPSYGEVVFKAAEAWTPFVKKSGDPIPSPEFWKLLTDDARGMLKVQAGNRIFALYLQKPTAAGDETVPSERSARKVDGMLFVHGPGKGASYEHQASYSDQNVLTSLLYSIVRIAGTAKWS